jgi:hypothetical protein
MDYTTLDSEEFFEEMAKMFPRLLEKASIRSFGVGSGWHNILMILCTKIYEKVDRDQQLLRYEREYNPNVDEDSGAIVKLKTDITSAIDELPVISDVKEKYGTLRFYVYGATDADNISIDFAEALSGVTCEECGSPGERDSNTRGWIKTRCKKCIDK